jgi:hypothetical protein
MTPSVPQQVPVSSWSALYDHLKEKEKERAYFIDISAYYPYTTGK